MAAVRTTVSRTGSRASLNVSLDGYGRRQRGSQCTVDEQILRLWRLWTDRNAASTLSAWYVLEAGLRLHRCARRHVCTDAVRARSVSETFRSRGGREDQQIRVPRWHEQTEHCHGDCSVWTPVEFEHEDDGSDVCPSEERVDPPRQDWIQWVLDKHPRGVVHMLEEEELEQLGVLGHQTDSVTDSRLRAVTTRTCLFVTLGRCEHRVQSW